MSGCVYLLESPYGGDSYGCPEPLVLCGNDDYLKKYLLLLYKLNKYRDVHVVCLREIFGHECVM